MTDALQVAIVTLAAVGAGGLLFRRYWPWRRAAVAPPSSGCPTCASGPGCAPNDRTSAGV